MRIFLYAGVVLALMGADAIADDEPGKEQGASFTGTAAEVGPSPYAKQGGVGRVLIANGQDSMVFHILKDTKITKLVDRKSQPAKFEDVKKGDTLKAVHNGDVMKTDPAQAWATKLEIVKAAEKAQAKDIVA